MNYFKHPTAIVSSKAKIGAGTKIWAYVQIRENTQVGKSCILGNGVYIDPGVKIGDRVKIESKSCIFQGVTLENEVFVGPHVCFSNDKNPRAANEQGNLMLGGEWQIGKILVKKGASIGANSTILPNVTIGQYAMIGAGSVVTKNVPGYSLIFGNPAQIHGKVDKQGNIIKV